MAENALTRRHLLWSYPPDDTPLLIGFCVIASGLPSPSLGQKPTSQAAITQTPTNPSAPASAAGGISSDQARAALEVLNDPGKRAAFAATLNAIVKAQPGARATPDVAKPAPTETTVEGVTVPLAPDSLGAEVLLSAVSLVNNVSDRAFAALQTVQSLPLLYGWVVVMATNPIARGLLSDVAWRVALILICAAAAEYGLRRALRQPIHRMESLAPAVRTGDDPEYPPAEDDSSGLAEVADTEAPPVTKHHLPSAWTLLNRVPLVLARLVLAHLIHEHSCDSLAGIA